MLRKSAHTDTFSRDNLPPAEQWPELLLDKFDYPDTLNAAYELTDAMVEKGFGDHTALIGNGRRRTYKELTDWTNRLANVLVDDLKVKPGKIIIKGLVIPMTGRAFPHELELAHDVAGWHAALMDVRGAGHHDDWERQDIPRLRDFGPAPFLVEDPVDACRTTMGQDIAFFLQHHLSWDLRSGVARAQIEPIGLDA